MVDPEGAGVYSWATLQPSMKPPRGPICVVHRGFLAGCVETNIMVPSDRQGTLVDNCIGELNEDVVSTSCLGRHDLCTH